MPSSILYVDDEQNILDACRRSLGRKYNITTALGPIEGLNLIKSKGPFAVILSDMRMPEMNGVEFICAARKLSPDTVCMMLTGNADQQTATDAINEGHVFRFMTKPCPSDMLANAFDAAIKQYRLITAEKELLQRTLTGSIRALMEALEMVSPRAFSRANRIKPLVQLMCNELKLENQWQYTLAAMMSQIGCITLPPELIEKIHAGKHITDAERAMFNAHPSHGQKLLEHIPRLERCAQMIGSQFKPFGHSAMPDPQSQHGPSEIGAQMLKIAIDYDARVQSGMAKEEALATMQALSGEYNPHLLAVLEVSEISNDDPHAHCEPRPMTVNDLLPDMIAAEDIFSESGVLLVSKGSTITKALKERLRNYSRSVGVKEPFNVLVPFEEQREAA
ncbi:MAG: response regulator [Phycisphaeraceae bacterium]|nr:response regulator [Phycisphaerales bacterium]MCB9860682.1 response regulator [Phycisphaeraceae bacterium]